MISMAAVMIPYTTDTTLQFDETTKNTVNPVTISCMTLLNIWLIDVMIWRSFTSSVMRDKSEVCEIIYAVNVIQFRNI